MDAPSVRMMAGLSQSFSEPGGTVVRGMSRPGNALDALTHRIQGVETVGGRQLRNLSRLSLGDLKLEEFHAETQRGAEDADSWILILPVPAF